jgi:hypothetical protein
MKNFKGKKGRISLAVILLSLALPINLKATSSYASSFPTSLTPAGEKAVQQISDCVNSKRNLQVFYLVDGSGSLEHTDPKNLRADVLAASLEQLKPNDDSLKVSYAVGTFGSDYRLLKKWAPLTSDNAVHEANWFRANIPGLSKEGNTNWEKGLLGADKELAKVRNQENAPCQAVVWLTDGGIDLQLDKHFIGERNSIANICGTDPGQGGNSVGDGVISRLRNSGVNVLGVLLKDDSFMNSLNSSDSIAYKQLIAEMSYLQPIVEGSSQVDGFIFGSSNPTFQCGPEISSGQANGAELVATDPLQLALQFARVVARSNNGSPTNVFGDNPAKFVIDPGVAYFDLLVSSKNWALQDPSGKTISTPTSGIASKSVAGAYLVRVKIDNKAQQGTWSIQNTTHNQADVFLYSGLKLNVSAKNFLAGKPAEINGQVIDQNGKPADLSVYGSNSIRVTSFNSSKGIDSEVPLTSNLVAGTFGGSFQPAKGVSQATFDVTLGLQTKSGVKLAPLTLQVQARVGLPPEYPHIQGDGLTLTDLSGIKGKATGSLILEGSNISDGQVCLGQPAIKIDPTPSRISNFTWDKSGQGCINVAKGSTQKVEYSLSNSHQTSGSSFGVIPATFKTNKEGLTPIDQGIALNFNSKIKENTPVQLAVLIGLLLAGIAIPTGILYFFGYRNSRILWGQGIQRASVPVILSSAGTITRNDGKPSEGIGPGIAKREYEWLGAPAERLRSTSDAWTDGTRSGSVEIKGRASKNPFGDPVVQVTATEASRVITSLGGMENGGRVGRIGVDIASAWYVAIPESELSRPDANGQYNATFVSFLRHDASKSSQAADRNAEAGTFSGLALVENIKADQAAASQKAAEGKSKKVKSPKVKKNNGGPSQVEAAITESDPFSSSGYSTPITDTTGATGTTSQPSSAKDPNPFGGSTPPPGNSGGDSNPFGGNY